MHKYLKLLLATTVSSMMLHQSAVAQTVTAQEPNSSEEENSEEEDGNPSSASFLTSPSLIPSSTSTGIEASAVYQAQTAGVNSQAATALGATALRTLSSGLTGTAKERAADLATRISVVDAYSNVEASNKLLGRRAINPAADLTTIVNSTLSLTADHLDTLGKLEVSHMSTFASDGIANIDNFATRVDVTSAMVGTELGSITTANLSTLVEHLHSSLDGDSLTALKSLEKSHMTTLVGSGDKKIDLTASFDASVIKKSVKKFATKAEVTVEFAKAAAPTSAAGVVDLSKIDLGAIATNIHANLDDDHLAALQNLSPTHMASMAIGVDLTSSEINVGNTLSHFATKAEVIVEFAKAAAPTSTADTSGNIDFSKIDVAGFVKNVHASLDTDHTTALSNLDPSHMATMAKGTDFSAGLKVDDLSHFATKAEVIVEFAKVAAPTAEAGATGKFDFANVKIDDFVTSVNTLNTDNTKALANLDPKHMATMAAGTDLSAGLNADHLNHFATKAEVVVEFAKVGSKNSTADGFGKFDFSAINIDEYVSTANALDIDSTKALAKLDPSHMATMAADTDMSAGFKADDLSHFATKGELASAYIGDGGASVDINSIITNVHATITVEFTTSLKEFSPEHMATMATGVDITAIASVGHKAKVAHAYKDTAGSSANIADILSNVGNISTADLLHFAELDHTSLKAVAADTDITKVHQDAAHKAKAVAAGYSLTDALALEGDALAALANSSKDELKAAKAGGKTLDDHAGETLIAGTKISENTEIDTAAKAVKTDAKAKGNTYTNAAATTDGFPKALESAVKVAELLLTDKTISNSSMNVSNSLDVSKLSGNGYNTELIRILAKYGALGTKGGALSDAVLGTGFTAFDKSIGLSSKVQPNTSSYQQFLTTLGARALGADKTNNNVFSLPTSNITLNTGANINFSPGAEVDVSQVLPKGDRRIAIIGAAKDLTIKGNLRIKNTNNTENGALVIGAADDLYFRSEYSSTSGTPTDYSGDPTVVSITNEGANLALGAEDTMRLVNVSISTGGNLAIGTLNDLHIGTATAQSNSLSVGNGGQNSDSDNIYLYANSLIQVNGLNITGRVDDVYMEAVTINLRNVNFPNSSEVTLRSQNGTLGFNNFASPVVGAVNLSNVRHGSDVLSLSSFTGTAGKYATSKVLPNGTPAVQVKKF
jgi:hypothetical protein